MLAFKIDDFIVHILDLSWIQKRNLFVICIFTTVLLILIKSNIETVNHSFIFFLLFNFSKDLSIYTGIVFFISLSVNGLNVINTSIRTFLFKDQNFQKKFHFTVRITVVAFAFECIQYYLSFFELYQINNYIISLLDSVELPLQFYSAILTNNLINEV